MANTNYANLQSVANDQTRAADQYYQNLPQMNQTQGQQLSENAYAGQHHNQQDINRGMGQRGMLYSGLNAGAQAGNQYLSPCSQEIPRTGMPFGRGRQSYTIHHL